MELYYGGNTNADSVVTWTQGNNTTPGTTALGTTRDSLKFNLWYYFDSVNHFNLVNGDYVFTSTSPKTTVTVNFPDASYNYWNTEVFLFFPPIHGILCPPTFGVIPNSLNSFIIFGYYSDSIPIGMNYELIFVSNKGNSYSYFEQSGTTTSGMTINAAMVSETTGDIVARLAGL